MINSEIYNMIHSISSDMPFVDVDDLMSIVFMMASDEQIKEHSFCVRVNTLLSHCMM